MKNLKINQKIIFIISFAIVFFVWASSYNIVQIKKLGVMEDEGAKRTNNALVIQKGGSMGKALYMIIARAQINRNLEVAEKEWDIIKEKLTTFKYHYFIENKLTT